MRALTDLDRLLFLAPGNEAALEAKSRVSTSLADVPPPPAPAPALAPKSEEDSPEWMVEKLRSEALRHMQNGEASKAAPVLERALAIAAEGGVDKHSVVSLQHLLATAYAAVDDNGNALRVYGDILKTDSSNHKANLKSAETHLRMVRNSFPYVQPYETLLCDGCRATWRRLGRVH